MKISMILALACHVVACLANGPNQTGVRFRDLTKEEKPSPDLERTKLSENPVQHPAHPVVVSSTDLLSQPQPRSSGAPRCPRLGPLVRQRSAAASVRTLPRQEPGFPRLPCQAIRMVPCLYRPINTLTRLGIRYETLSRPSGSSWLCSVPSESAARKRSWSRPPQASFPRYQAMYRASPARKGVRGE